MSFHFFYLLAHPSSMRSLPSFLPLFPPPPSLLLLLLLLLLPSAESSFLLCVYPPPYTAAAPPHPLPSPNHPMMIKERPCNRARSKEYRTRSERGEKGRRVRRGRGSKGVITQKRRTDRNDMQSRTTCITTWRIKAQNAEQLQKQITPSIYPAIADDERVGRGQSVDGGDGQLRLSPPKSQIMSGGRSNAV